METPGKPALPKVVKLLWDLDDAGSRGPKRGLSVDQIVAAATAVADAEGFAALSMGRVAKELGFTTMSLYRYVDSKDTLMELLFDRSLGDPPDLSDAPGWRAKLEAWAWAEFRGIQQHYWWLDLPLSSPPLGPKNMAWLEAGMTAMAEVPITEPHKLQLVTNLSIYVVGRTRFLRDTAKQQQQDVDYAGILAQVIDPARFPTVTSAIMNNAFEDDDMNWEEADFGFALARLLDGYQVFIDAHTTG
ncbi:TetR/AcrR family transcriptional regulator [Nocardia sp. NBC_00511]|uniref:TetR/AcrR family transcriptional regulator n=1 Tax=Nocardia sp. NBC_00511 TaxID=2903591 RepID=UPI0030DDE296